ncbi:hypothetical protein NKJ74_31995, partial [Mesorhizobium sp. M0046]
SQGVHLFWWTPHASEHSTAKGAGKFALTEEALGFAPEAVLLDNMLDELRHAVAMVAGRAITEASGPITLDMAAQIAATGVDLISIGWLTHSAPILDIALDYRDS